jgi:hypothetical protein
MRGRSVRSARVRLAMLAPSSSQSHVISRPHLTDTVQVPNCQALGYAVGSLPQASSWSRREAALAYKLARGKSFSARVTPSVAKHRLPQRIASSESSNAETREAPRGASQEWPRGRDGFGRRRRYSRMVTPKWYWTPLRSPDQTHIRADSRWTDERGILAGVPLSFFCVRVKASVVGQCPFDPSSTLCCEGDVRNTVLRNSKLHQGGDSFASPARSALVRPQSCSTSRDVVATSATLQRSKRRLRGAVHGT